MSTLVRRSIATIVGLTFFFPYASIANENQANTLVHIPHSTKGYQIDGDLTDPVWLDAKSIAVNTVTSPLNNTPSPVDTQAKLVDTGEHILIAFIAKHPNPQEIIATYGERDSRWSDDIVGIKLDTLNNRRTTYTFLVNAFGIQHDEIYNEITGNANDLWDGIWDSYGKITNDGFQVEMAIPYSIMNFEESDNVKQWPFELVRVHADQTRLRISNIELDRNNACWLCQYPQATGFENARAGSNLQLTPALVASYDEQRDIYDTDSDWDSDSDIEPSLDVRWGIDRQTLLNATINPDFSTVEADAAQLSVNNKFSLFFQEKRPFFLENNNFFETPTNLVYTRNIADPDYGVKLTGTNQAHSYGIFVSHDTETNFILSGNLSARIASLNEESHSSAVRYLYDIDQNKTIGLIATNRTSDDYHNSVFGIDGRYRFTDTDRINVQWMFSDTEYPEALFQDFCDSDCEPPSEPCSFGNCNYNEQVLRSKKDDSFDDAAYLISYLHESEDWIIDAERQYFGEDFRADLGFINRIDYVDDRFYIRRKFFQDDEKAMIPTYGVNAAFSIQHNDNDELISRENQLGFSLDGPLRSYLELTYVDATKVGLRLDDTNLAIDENTERFNERQWVLYAESRLNREFYASFYGVLGDKIDYDNNRLGDYIELETNVTWYPKPNTEVDATHTFSELEAENKNVYTANIMDLRLRYYFDVHSSLKLSLVYEDIDYNPDNNPFSFYSEQVNTLSTQLIYSYKLNPQTVFFLGYSDNSFEDDFVGNLKQQQRTLFTKISYAWR
ncbi:sugar-binding protein [Thalassotalea euphylliae]|uniref:carbohydrate binding family 9 domain-containing protein n=1 Tax=Thalassotalea euphylliae TaxID=1655234 RepID=UPI0036377907